MTELNTSTDQTIDGVILDYANDTDTNYKI